MIETILTALVAGITYSLTGFGKEPDEKFDVGKFITTVVVGLIIGVIMVAMNITESAAFQYASTVGLTAIVQNIIGTINKRVLPKIA